MRPRVTLVDLLLLIALSVMAGCCILAHEAWAAAAFAYLAGEHAGRHTP